MADHLSALFAEPEAVPADSAPHSDPTRPESEPGPEVEPHEPAEPAPPAEPGEEKPPEVVEGEEPADRDGKVSVQALHRERDKRRELQEKAAADAERIARLEGRFQQLLHTMQRPPEQPQRAPTPEDDPIAVLRQLQQEQQQRQHASGIDAARNQFEGHVAGLEQQFMRQQPDYAQAAEFLQRRRAADLQAMGIADQGQIRNVLYQEAAGMAANAMQAGKNPAEVAYNLARSWGYQPPGQTPPVAPEARLEAQQRGMEASRSLSAGGGRGPQQITVDVVDRMSDEDFAAFAGNEAKWRKLFGE